MSRQDRSQTLRNCTLVASVVLCAFVWLATLTFDAADWPNTAVWPQPDPVHNACGRAGAWITFHLFHYLGGGVWPLLICLTLGSIAGLARRRVGDLALRAVGLGLLVSVTAVSAALLNDQVADGLVEGPGGILGISLAAALAGYFSSIGARLAVIAAAIVGLLLLADDVIFRVPAAAVWLWRKLTQLAETLRSAGVPRPALTATTMGAGNRATITPLEKAAARTNVSPARGESVDDETEADDFEIDDAAVGPATGAVDDPEPIEAAEAGSDEAGDDEELDADADADEDRLPEDKRTPLERELIIRMLGRDRVEGAPPKSAWPKELGDYLLPPLTLLRDPEVRFSVGHEGLVREQAAVLERTLAEFRIDVRVVEIDTGPVITLFELQLSAGTKVSQINSLANDIARALKAPAVRVVAPIPGKNTIGIEVPNLDKEVVRLKELIMLGGVKPTKMALPVFIGKNASGDPLIGNLAAMPHLLIAGTTGSGKSVAINALIMSILMTQRPDHVKLILIDPKMVELSVFKDIPHLMCPIVTDMQQAELILQWATTKMDERYELLAEAGVKDVASFNRLSKETIYERFQPTTEQEKLQIPTHLPYIVIVIDELADLMMTSGKEVEHHLSRLAQKSRAVGIHLLVATQRPQANVVTGLIKSNLPCRLAFRVASRMDSRIVLDQNGAEVLLGEGDMLYLPPGSSKLVRAQGTYVEEDEVRAVVADLGQKAKPEFHHELQRLRPGPGEEGGGRDPLFDKAVDIIVETQRGSVSLLQRRLEVGYSRASRLIDQMAAAGIVGEYKGSQAREVLLSAREWEHIRKQRDRDVDEGGADQLRAATVRERKGIEMADLDAEDDDAFGAADLDDRPQPTQVAD